IHWCHPLLPASASASACGDGYQWSCHHFIPVEQNDSASSWAKSSGEDMGIGARLLARLDEEFPRPHTALHHTTTLQLLVATILSAQCTDERVNQVTKTLFARYRTAQDYARADPRTLEREIRSTGFYKAK